MGGDACHRGRRVVGVCLPLTTLFDKINFLRGRLAVRAQSLTKVQLLPLFGIHYGETSYVIELKKDNCTFNQIALFVK